MPMQVGMAPRWLLFIKPKWNWLFAHYINTPFPQIWLVLGCVIKYCVLVLSNFQSKCSLFLWLYFLAHVPFTVSSSWHLLFFFTGTKSVWKTWYSLRRKSVLLSCVLPLLQSCLFSRVLQVAILSTGLASGKMTPCTNRTHSSTPTCVRSHTPVLEHNQCICKVIMHQTHCIITFAVRCLVKLQGPFNFFLMLWLLGEVL